MRREVTYTVNLLGPIFMLLALAIFVGAFGGDGFERGVAGLLTIVAADSCSITFKTESESARAYTLALLPISYALLLTGFILTLGGLS